MGIGNSFNKKSRSFINVSDIDIYSVYLWYISPPKNEWLANSLPAVEIIPIFPGKLPIKMTGGNLSSFQLCCNVDPGVYVCFKIQDPWTPHFFSLWCTSCPSTSMGTVAAWMGDFERIPHNYPLPGNDHIPIASMYGYVWYIYLHLP